MTTVTLNEGVTYTDSGTGNVLQLGNNDNVTASGDTIDIVSGDTETITGGSDTLVTGANAASTVNLTANTSVTDTGSGNTFNLDNGTDLIASSDLINIAANAAATVDGADDHIVLGNGGNLTLVSSGANTVNVGGSGSTVSTGGNGQGGPSDYVTFTDDGVLNEAGDANLNVFGSGITVNANGSDNLGLYGASDTATISGTGSQVWVGDNGQNGASNTITFINNDYITYVSVNDETYGAVLNEASDTNLNVFGTGVNVYAGGTDNLGLYGANNYATISDTGSQVWTGGNGQNGQSEYVYFLNGGVLNEAANTNLNAFGNGISVYANGSDNLGLYGANDYATITGAGSQVWIGGNTNNTASNYDTAIDYVTFDNGGVVYAGYDGGPYSGILGRDPYGLNDNVYGNGVTAYVSGPSYLGLYGANDTAIIGGIYAEIWTGGNGQNGASDYFTFDGMGILNEAADANINVSGSDVTVYANGSDNLALYGGGDTANINGTGTQVSIGGNGQNGTADYFNFANGGVVNEAADASINAYGSAITVNASASDNLGIYGTGDTVNLGANDDIWAGAGSDLFVLPGATGQDVITGFVATGSNYDTLQFSSSVFADWAHLLGATSQQGSDLLITIDANDTVLLKNTTLASFTSANAKFV